MNGNSRIYLDLDVSSLFYLSSYTLKLCLNCTISRSCSSMLYLKLLNPYLPYDIKIKYIYLSIYLSNIINVENKSVLTIFL